MSTPYIEDTRPDRWSPWQRNFEDTRVRILLEAFGLLGHLLDLLADCEAREGQRHLTFQSFHVLFPKFPILLRARCRYRVAEQLVPADLFRRFDDTFLMQYYLEAYHRFEGETEDRPIGLVVPFDGYRGGLVVHNGKFDTRSTAMTHAVPDDVPPHRVTVEPYCALVRYLANGGWEPDSPPAALTATNAPEVSKEMLMTRWMVKTIGNNASLVVLAWMRKILFSTSASDRIFVSRLGQGKRCVKATYEEIASETELSGRQVKRGLADLRAKGLVEPVGTTGRNGYLLTPTALAGEAAP